MAFRGTCYRHSSHLSGEKKSETLLLITQTQIQKFKTTKTDDILKFLKSQCVSESSWDKYV